jgi:hypothetical protein
MSNERVEVPKDAFVRKTGQLWKLIVGGFILPWPAVAIGLFTFRRIGRDQPTSEFVTGIAAMVAIAALMAFLLASIRCPRCSTRLLWDVFRHPDGLNALVDLLKARSCPKCGYTPHGAGD